MPVETTIELLDEEPLPCSNCGDTETIELSDELQTISVCATCGSDQ